MYVCMYVCIYIYTRIILQYERREMGRRVLKNRGVASPIRILLYYKPAGTRPLDWHHRPLYGAPRQPGAWLHRRFLPRVFFPRSGRFAPDRRFAPDFAPADERVAEGPHSLRRAAAHAATDTLSRAFATRFLVRQETRSERAVTVNIYVCIHVCMYVCMHMRFLGGRVRGEELLRLIYIYAYMYVCIYAYATSL